MTDSGPYDAITDVPGIKVGHWSDRQAATGCTVVLCETGAVPGFFNPGGAPGTIDTDVALPENSIQEVHAVLLTGGSTIGLEAATGVRRVLRERGVGLSLVPRQPTIPLVLGAVVFDLSVGLPSNPTAANGRSATRQARTGPIRQGTIGVGTGCTVAKTGRRETAIKGGVGTASIRHECGLVVGAIVATNAIGDIIDPETGALIAGARGELRGEMRRASTDLLNRSIADYKAALAAHEEASPDQAGANTTLCAIATNAKLHKGTAKRVAIMGSAGLARTISPVFTPGDGDSIFTLATGEIDVTTIPQLLTLTGTMAAEAVARATVRSVTTAESLVGVPSVSEWRAAS